MHLPIEDHPDVSAIRETRERSRRIDQIVGLQTTGGAEGRSSQVERLGLFRDES